MKRAQYKKIKKIIPDWFIMIKMKKGIAYITFMLVNNILKKSKNVKKT